MRRNIILLLLLIAGGGALLYERADTKKHMSLTKSDAIVLLAGNYKERGPATAELYREGYAPVVLLTNDGVFSGWSSKYGRNLYQVEWAEEYLVGLGVPRNSIVKLPFHGSSTMHDAVEVKRYVLEHGLEKIVIVTSDYHLRRAVWSFRKAFAGTAVELSGYPTASVSIGIRVRLLERGKFFYYLIKYGLFGLVPEIPGSK